MGGELDIKSLKDFKAHLARIARKNNDEFAVTITWDEKGYHLEVIETADRHTFLNVDGGAIFIVLDAAEGELREACKSWSYKYVD